MSYYKSRQDLLPSFLIEEWNSAESSVEDPLDNEFPIIIVVAVP